ncbi:TerB family tellurite resistance protein [Pontivivens insulae]|uniref:DnaJ-like protein DjlA n=1 Tax=Pontivivens insulae TaxID=1639689 RepID=A0A2R8AB79_9RHOB|nr:TerB family tellurite resistance protein [Pontivivens insulae]RED11354.1 tellurite resistance protein [Pontivivens insulae]SPF29473.1 DnaJ-like protein DjlA [Pontivivens insulae]
MYFKPAIAIATLCAMALLPDDAEARRRGGGIPFFGGGGGQQELHFLMETEYRDSAGSKLSLCHLIDHTRIMGVVSLYAEMDGYALSDDGCTGDTYYEFTREDVVEGKKVGLLPDSLPNEPEMPAQDKIVSMWGTFSIGALALIVIGVRVRATVPNAKRKPTPTAPPHERRPSRRQSRENRRAAEQADAGLRAVVLVMSHVAKADGKLDAEELKLLADVLRHMLDAQIPLAEIVQEVARVKPENFFEDMKLLEKMRLDPATSEAILGQAVRIASIDGQIDDSELAVIIPIARALRISDARRNEILG